MYGAPVEVLLPDLSEKYSEFMVSREGGGGGVKPFSAMWEGKLVYFYEG